MRSTGKRHSLYRDRFIIGLMSLFVSSLSQPLFADSLEDIQHFIDKGAIQLAITTIEREQLKYSEQPETWVRFEKQRIELYVQTRNWSSLINRVQKLPEFVSPKFRRWANTQYAMALIATGDGAEARRVLQQLLWSDPVPAGKQLQHWRRLVIESYLADGRVADAGVAMLRYRIDYPEQGVEDVMLRVHIELLNNRSMEVLNLLKPYPEDARTRPLILFTHLQNRARSAIDVYKDAQAVIKTTKDNPELHANLWLVSAEAASQAKSYPTAAYAYEFVIAQREQITLPVGIIRFDVDSLWQAYLDYALSLANRKGLLIGDDEKWIAYAKSIAKEHPVGARAMCAFVILRSRDNDMREKASVVFVELISKRDAGDYLLVTLFTESKHFRDYQSMPVFMRHSMVDIALRNSDIDFASKLMATIEKPPAGSDQFMWRLRRARILVLGNQSELGTKALVQILDTNKKLSEQQIDRFMQVLFDLQETGQHELALSLFARVFYATDDTKIQREIYFWMAESHKALKQYSQAAEFYLKSAMYPQPEAMDPWAQTAVYQAANMLTKAGLYSDARVLYQNLLDVTEDPSRRKVLEKELQSLWSRR